MVVVLSQNCARWDEDAVKCPMYSVEQGLEHRFEQSHWQTLHLGTTSQQRADFPQWLTGPADHTRDLTCC
jgi:hypothetical protein